MFVLVCVVALSYASEVKDLTNVEEPQIAMPTCAHVDTQEEFNQALGKLVEIGGSTVNSTERIMETVHLFHEKLSTMDSSVVFVEKSATLIENLEQSKSKLGVRVFTLRSLKKGPPALDGYELLCYKYSGMLREDMQDLNNNLHKLYRYDEFIHDYYFPKKPPSTNSNSGD
jgi:hypothetical protein